MIAVTIDIVCMDCRESLWIGQIYRGHNESQLNLYANVTDHTGWPDHNSDTEKQRRFYAKHLGHVLMCVDGESGSAIADNEFEHDEDSNRGPIEHQNLDDREWRDTVNAGVERVIKSGVLLKEPRKGADGSHALLNRRQEAGHEN